MTSANLEIKNVKKSFKNENVLNGISLNLEGNKIYGIVGRNGSGKSVLFKIICGFLKADCGEVIFNGQIIGKDVDFPPDLGAVIESPGFLWYQSGFANLEYLAGIRKKITKQQVKDTIRLVGLDPESKKWVGKYSVGMKQRLSIAQAIMEDPKLIILDEPMNGLDEEGVNEMRQLFISLKDSNRIIILASHNREDIEALCDDVYELSKGNIKSKFNE